ncbi:type I restriction-modification system subunit M N-terminal domain-containing protein [Endozoicomonas euniceicola]|uniref:Type I restriction-modification system subunit M N-terminal domain-containing protein n=1 Tax=Endozoicomonas euniceicola TaxID=1234143 RepID=A0ABY6GRT8_9GAMM|nr:type I restriction-modification system subunit M N-terminal domain-containing protein [Endozoicomonas euniceicola]UYM15405.1 type I restriction-modification system subunit M N-terminal domain-containing protein [Endozoicomonas euniceicola]
MTNLTLDQLEHHLWMAAHIITGPIDALDYKTYIFPILFFKRISDVFDEELLATIEEFDDEALARTKREKQRKNRGGKTWWGVVFGKQENTQKAPKHRPIDDKNPKPYDFGFQQ